MEAILWYEPISVPGQRQPTSKASIRKLNAARILIWRLSSLYSLLYEPQTLSKKHHGTAIYSETGPLYRIMREEIARCRHAGRSNVVRSAISDTQREYGSQDLVTSLKNTKTHVHNKASSPKSG